MARIGKRFCEFEVEKSDKQFTKLLLEGRGRKTGGGGGRGGGGNET